MEAKLRPVLIVILGVILVSASALAACIASRAQFLCGKANWNFQTCFNARTSRSGDGVEVVRVFERSLNSPKVGEHFPAQSFETTTFNDPSEVSRIVGSGDEFFVCGADVDVFDGQILTPISLSGFRPAIVMALENNRSINLPDHPTTIDAILAEALLADDYESCLALIDPREVPDEGCPDEVGLFGAGCSTTRGKHSFSFLFAAILVLGLRFRKRTRDK